ncbi:MurR/RpiR family transcriptional regulator [Mycoplasma sp. 6243]|uniref:MurR/RpiR family transcriptional regulator n=1 Tax=Mycoplasma sp. 6243 TaxID=3440865 RepID=UPI003EBD57C9
MKKEIFDNNLKQIITSNQHIKSLIKLTDFISLYPNGFLELSTLQLSDKLDVSQATISRISKILGFRNIQDIRIYISARLQYLDDRIDWNNNESSENLSDVISNIKSHYMFSIEKSVNKFLDNKYIYKYINTLLEYKINLFFGIGDSGMISAYFANNLRKIGFNVLYCSDVHTFLSFNSLLQLKKVHVTVISKSGTTLEIKFVINFLETNNIPYSVWTKNQSLQSNHSLNLLYVDSLEQKYRIGVLGSKISYFMLCDIIYSFLSVKIDKNKKIFSQINDYISSWNNLLDNKK